MQEILPQLKWKKTSKSALGICSVSVPQDSAEALPSVLTRSFCGATIVLGVMRPNDLNATATLDTRLVDLAGYRVNTTHIWSVALTQVPQVSLTVRTQFGRSKRSKHVWTERGQTSWTLMTLAASLRPSANHSSSAILKWA